MISPCCDLYEFVEAVQERSDYYEVLYLAEIEATEAERLRFRKRGGESRNQECCPRYAESLKGFISFLRYGIQTRHVHKEDIQTFRSLRDRLMDGEGSEEMDQAGPAC